MICAICLSGRKALGVITAATMKLFPQPVARATAFAEVRDVAAAVELLHRLQAVGWRGRGIRAIPADILHVVFHHFPDIPQPLAARGAMNVLMEIGSSNPPAGWPMTAARHHFR